MQAQVQAKRKSLVSIAVKFAVTGAIGTLIGYGITVLFTSGAGIPYYVSYWFGIGGSYFTNLYGNIRNGNITR